jgi:hypothetical protein
MRIQQLLRGQRLPPIPHLLSVMVTPKQVRVSERLPNGGGIYGEIRTHHST